MPKRLFVASLLMGTACGRVSAADVSDASSSDAAFESATHDALTNDVHGAVTDAGPPHVAWARGGGSGGVVWGKPSLAVDSKGAITFAVIDPALMFDATAPPCTTTALVHLTPGGELGWSRCLDGGYWLGASVGVDARGNIRVGRGLIQNAGEAPAFTVEAFSADGDAQWSRVTFAKSGGAGAGSIAVAADGESVSVGSASGEFSFDGPEQWDPAIIVRYTASGTRLWSRAIGRCSGVGCGRVSFTAVALDPTGNAYVTGLVWSTKADFGAGVTEYGDGLVIVSYDPTGALRWVRHFSEPYDLGGQRLFGSIAVDASGGVVVAGYTRDTLALAPGVTVPAVATGTTAFVCAWDSTGGYRWHRAWSNPARDGVGGVALDVAGSVFVARSGVADDDAVVLQKLASEGSPIWTFRAQPAGAGANPLGRDVAIGPDGTLVATGSLDGAATFGSFSVTGPQNDAAPNGGLWLAKLTH